MCDKLFYLFKLLGKHIFGLRGTMNLLNKIPTYYKPAKIIEAQQFIISIVGLREIKIGCGETSEIAHVLIDDITAPGAKPFFLVKSVTDGLFYEFYGWLSDGESFWSLDEHGEFLGLSRPNWGSALESYRAENMKEAIKRYVDEINGR